MARILQTSSMILILLLGTVARPLMAQPCGMADDPVTNMHAHQDMVMDTSMQSDMDCCETDACAMPGCAAPPAAMMAPPAASIETTNTVFSTAPLQQTLARPAPLFRPPISA